jgi:hypothetical protein
MGAAHDTEPALGKHTLPHHAEAERPWTPPPTDFRQRFARMGPPENKVDRSARVRLPVLRLRPTVGVHKQPRALRPLGHLSTLLNFSATPRTSCHVFTRLPPFRECGRADVVAALPEPGFWLKQEAAYS